MPRHLPKPLSTADAVDDLLARQRHQADETIGDLVLWRIEELEITPEDLKAFLTRRGIQNWAPVDIRKKTAARKAISKVRKDLEAGNLKVLVRRVQETKEEVRYAIVNEMVDLTAQDLDYSTRNQVVFDKTAGTLSFTVEPIPEIEEKFEYLSSVYTQREVNTMIENIVKGYNGVPMKDGSGMWYMPVAVRHIVDSLKELVNTDLLGNEKYNARGFFRVWGILNNEENRAGVESVFKNDIEWELVQAKDALQRILDSDKPRQSQVTMALDRYKEAAGKARMYRKLLQINVEEVEEALTAGRRSLENMLGLAEKKEDDAWLHQEVAA